MSFLSVSQSLYGRMLAAYSGDHDPFDYYNKSYIDSNFNNVGESFYNHLLSLGIAVNLLNDNEIGFYVNQSKEVRSVFDNRIFKLVDNAWLESSCSI